MFAGHDFYRLQGGEKKEIMSAECKGKIRRFSIEIWVECRCSEAEKQWQVSLMTKSAGKQTVLWKRTLKQQNTVLGGQKDGRQGQITKCYILRSLQAYGKLLLWCTWVCFCTTKFKNLVVKVGKWVRHIEMHMSKVTYISATSNWEELYFEATENISLPLGYYMSWFIQESSSLCLMS